MSEPIFIHEEKFTAVSSVDFSSGGIGQINNSGDAFDESGVGADSIFGRLMFVGMISLSASAFLEVLFDGGGSRPSRSAKYDYFNRGFDTASPGTTDQLSVVNQVQGLPHPIAFDNGNAGHRLNFIMHLKRIDGSPPAAQGVFDGMSIEGCMHQSVGGLGYFEGNISDGSTTILDGCFFEPSTGTMSGVIRLYAWPRYFT